MPTLFDTNKAGDLVLANRIVMAPLTRNRSPNAVPPAMARALKAAGGGAALLPTAREYPRNRDTDFPYRHDILLDAQRRDEEAVNDVLRGHGKLDGLAAGTRRSL